MTRALLLLPMVWLAACGSDPITCGSPANAAGTWGYTGNQSSPTAALTGTMTLTRTGTCTLQGTLSLTIDTGSGSPTTDAGPVAVIFTEATTMDLTAQVQGERFHLGEWVGDTISGSWNLTSGGASGSFKMVRGGTP